MHPLTVKARSARSDQRAETSTASSPVFDATGAADDDARRWAQEAQLHGAGCGCALHGRRLFTRWLGAGAAGTALGGTLAGADEAQAREGVDVGEASRTARLIPAEQLEQAAAQQYQKMLQEAQGKRALAPDDHPQVQRLRSIAQRIIPFSNDWNPRARNWRWEVNLIGSSQVNAFCMPGGKIAFYLGILDRLQLNDDEVAMIMGHEAAHALREHAREQMAKGAVTRGALEIGAALLGLGELGRLGAGFGAQLLSLRFGRTDESEADLVGLELAARAGYQPRAGVTLWEKMGSANGGGAPPQWLSTHPKGANRIRDLEANIPKVAGLFERAPKPAQRFNPPPRTAAPAAR
jgi:Zn-dependent protease with chaperone function